MVPTFGYDHDLKRVSPHSTTNRPLDGRYRRTRRARWLHVCVLERLTLEFEADSDPGIYPVHCHKVDHVTTDGRYPGGMATAIVYEEAMGSDEFAEVMDDAGFEG